MTFLAIIVALILTRFWGSAKPVQRDQWFRHWQSALANVGVGAVGRLVLAVGLPVLVAQGVLNVLEPWFFLRGLPALVCCAVLLRFTGPGGGAGLPPVALVP